METERPRRCLMCEARRENPICRLGGGGAARFSEIARTAQYRTGQPLFLQGDRGGDVYLIRSGQVKVTYHHADGAEQVLRIAGPGETVGIGMSIGSDLSVSAIARTACTVCRVRLTDLEALLQRNPEFALAWTHVLTDEIRRVREAVLHLGPHSASVRLARFLVASMSANDRGRAPLISMTHVEIAASLSIAYETATRLLRSLEESGILRLSRGRIEVLDPDRLLALAGHLDSRRPVLTAS